MIGTQNKIADISCAESLNIPPPPFYIEQQQLEKYLLKKGVLSQFIDWLFKNKFTNINLECPKLAESAASSSGEGGSKLSDSKSSESALDFTSTSSP